MTVIPRDYTEDIIETGDYDDCVSLGKSTQEDMDTGRWVIGDLALRVGKDYGKDKVGEFAKDIQVKKSTVQDYRRMSSYWSPDDREEVMSNYAVNYSVMRVAMRFKDVKESKRFFEQCANEGGIHTVDHYEEKASQILGAKAGKPKKLGHADFVCVRSENGKVTFTAENIHPDMVEQLHIGDMYKLMIYPIEDTDA